MIKDKPPRRRRTSSRRDNEDSSSSSSSSSESEDEGEGVTFVKSSQTVYDQRVEKPEPNAFGVLESVVQLRASYKLGSARIVLTRGSAKTIRPMVIFEIICFFLFFYIFIVFNCFVDKFMI